jgi:Fanconi-associated nuclease 1
MVTLPVHSSFIAFIFQEQDFKAIEHHLAPAWDLLDRQENKISDSNGLQPSFYMQYNCKWIYCVMATVGVGMLERKKEYRLAIERLQQLLGGIYCQERRGYWWIRLSINLEHIGRPNDSLEIAETAMADPSIRPDERLTLQRRILKLAKPPRRWKKPSWAKSMPKDPKVVVIEGSPLDNTRGGKSRFLGYDCSVCSVEQLALQYYASNE